MQICMHSHAGDCNLDAAAASRCSTVDVARHRPNMAAERRSQPQQTWARVLCIATPFSQTIITSSGQVPSQWPRWGGVCLRMGVGMGPAVVAGVGANAGV
eukprot:2596553-Pleurochrysis_carterae.AAC.1